MSDPIDKFAERVALTEDGCLLWLGGKFKKGYGSFYLKGKYHRAHRWLWAYLNGDPGELLVDHKCRNRLCVHPDHLRLTTDKQNSENRNGERGVTFIPRLNKWAARLCHNGKDIWIGTFADQDAAKAAVIEARNSYFTHNESDRTPA